MASANLVVIMGNLTRDPELRYTPSGSAVATLQVAVNRRYKDKNSGQWVEAADFIPVTVWGNQAENCDKYLSKGRGVHIEGRISQSRWETPEGDTRSKLEVVARTVQFLPSGGSGQSGKEEQDNDIRSHEPVKEDTAGFDASGEEDEEIPF